jgi:DNA-binding NarL/FixJ family response regulator
MKKKTTEALIVSRSIVLQQGLGALLESLPGITNVKAIRDLSNAYTWMEAHHPGILLLDAAVTGNDPRPALEKIQKISPHTQRVLLVDDVQEVNLMPRYVEAILIKGVSPSAVAGIVTSLLLSKGD